MGGADRTIQTLQNGMSKAFFEQRKSRINGALKQALAQAANAYLIQAVGRRPRTRYFIPLALEQIDYKP